MMTATNQDKQYKFSGFDIPQQNWFRLPNDWTDITAEMRSWAEHKVVEYVLRHTWGYQEYGILKQISLDEFEHGRRRKDGTRIDKGLGMRRQAIISGLKQAVEDGFLIEQVDDSDKGRVKKFYGVRMRGDSGNSENDDDHNQGYDNHTPGVRQSYSPGMKIIHRTEKDTKERNTEKEKSNNSSGEPDPNQDVVVALTEKGITERIAKQLANQYNRSRILEKIEFLEFLLETSPEKVKNPKGWLRRAIEENYGPPGGYQTQAEREAEAKAAGARQREQQAQEAALLAEKAQEDAHRTETLEAHRKAVLAEYAPSEDLKQLWEQVLMQIRGRSATTYQAFLTNSALLAINGQQVKVWVKDAYTADFLAGQNYTVMMARLIAKEIDQPFDQIRVEFIYPNGEP